LYEVLEANITALRLPTTRITTNSGESMEFPKVTTHAIATQVAGQGTTIGGSDPVFGKFALLPVKYGALIKLASEVVSDSGVDIVGFVSRDLGRAVSRRVNTAIMAEFIANAFVGSAGTASTGGSLVGPSFGSLVDLEYSILDSYRSSTSTSWVTNDSTAGLIRKLRDGAGGTEGAPLWQPSLQGGISGLRTPDRLFGYPVYTDPNIAAAGSNAKILYFGDMSSYYVRTVGSMMIERNDSVGFAEDQSYFRGKWRADAGAADLTAINAMKMSVS
jgi:HK97 family phage major capsid protein